MGFFIAAGVQRPRRGLVVDVGRESIGGRNGGAGTQRVGHAARPSGPQRRRHQGEAARPPDPGVLRLVPCWWVKGRRHRPLALPQFITITRRLINGINVRKSEIGRYKNFIRDKAALTLFRSTGAILILSIFFLPCTSLLLSLFFLGTVASY